MATILLLAVLVAFATTFVMTPYAIRYFRFIGITSTDVHKKNKPLVPYPAGVPLVAGVLAGVFVYIFLNVFIYGNSADLVSMFAALTSILIVMFAGFLDDLNSLQIKVGKFIEGKGGLKQWQRPLLTLPAAIPLMAIMAGDTTMIFPIIGPVNFGILFPLLIVPIGVVGASNMVNMLGGYNGLEVGMGLIYTFALGLFAFLNGSLVSAVLFFMTFAGLLGVLRYNFFPAKILPGDSLTYTLGAVVATGAIVGDMEKATIIIMIPFIIQGVLKFYSYFKLGKFATDLGILQDDGTIKPRYGKSVFSWIHLITNLGNLTERKIVLVMVLIQVFFAAIPFLEYFQKMII